MEPGNAVYKNGLQQTIHNGSVWLPVATRALRSNGISHLIHDIDFIDFLTDQPSKPYHKYADRFGCWEKL